MVVPITTKVVSFDPAHGVFDTTLYNKFVSNLRQMGGFRRIPRLPPPIILTGTT
jgi:hypothetical protein